MQEVLGFSSAQCDHFCVPLRHPSGDLLISGFMDEASIKEELITDYTESGEMPFVELTGGKKRDLCLDCSRDASLATDVPPVKRCIREASAAGSQTSSSSDAQLSPPDSGNTVFTNRAFQSSEGFVWGIDGHYQNPELQRMEPGFLRMGTTATAGGIGFGIQRTFSERGTGQSIPPQSRQYQVQQDQLPQPNRPLTFQPLPHPPCSPLLEVSGHQARPASVSFGVQADKGFQFSGKGAVWICQKKNHFQITCIAGVSGEQWAVPIPAAAAAAATAAGASGGGTNLQLVTGFQLSLRAVHSECAPDFANSPPVGLEQADPNRARRVFETAPLTLPGRGQRVRAVAGRLHFASATLNNQRRRGELHPDQRFFQLVVTLEAVTSPSVPPVPLGRLISGLVIVRASNPGQFETGGAPAAAAAAPAETPVSAAQTANWVSDVPGVTHVSGRVGINTRYPGEALTVQGNLQLHGTLLQPSDARIKSIERELSPAEQLANISRIRIYTYSLSPTVRDTGVIAQELASVLPDAVRKSSTQRVPGGEPLLLVNKDRIYMENVGAVKQLGELTASLERRIGELERMRNKLCRLRDSLRGSPSSAAAAAAEADTEAQDEATNGSGSGAPEARDLKEAAVAVPAPAAKAPASGGGRVTAAGVAIALLSVLCCCFCALAALLLVDRLALTTASSSSGVAATTTKETMTSTITTTSTLLTSMTHNSTTPGSLKATSATSSSSLTSLWTSSTSTVSEDDGIIRPGGDFSPVRCCRRLVSSNSSLSSPASALSPTSPTRSAVAAAVGVVVWELRTVRLMSGGGLGDWTLRPNVNARCVVAGEGENDAGRPHRLRFGDDCAGVNITVGLRLGSAFPTDAVLHLRLNTDLTAAYCGPARVYAACSDGSNVGDVGGACVPVDGTGGDCNLGRAAAHLKHLARLRMMPPGLTETDPCQLSNSALGDLFIELQILIERQPYGCD